MQRTDVEAWASWCASRGYGIMRGSSETLIHHHPGLNQRQGEFVDEYTMFVILLGPPALKQSPIDELSMFLPCRNLELVSAWKRSTMFM